MDNAEKFIKFTVQRVLDKCSADLEFFNNVILLDCSFS